jgi:hypothetical protein
MASRTKKTASNPKETGFVYRDKLGGVEWTPSEWDKYYKSLFNPRKVRGDSDQLLLSGGELVAERYNIYI